VARTVLAQAADGTHQIVGYFDGVGTRGLADKFTGGAFGDGMCENVVAIYRFILYNYVRGDELYFFGFSRGAFTVRTLAGFMQRVGLMDKDDDYYVPEIFSLYEKGSAPDSPEWKKAFRKADHRPCPPIRFIGVWDTVGALGAPGYIGKLLNKNKYLFHDVRLGPHIQNAFHAMAIDERRKAFEPTLWERPKGWTGQLEQAWFCGVHCNVGGGYKPDGLANEALHWIVEKAEGLGLEFDVDAIAHYEPHYTSRLQDSMTAMYRPLGVLHRPIGKCAKVDGEAVHESVLDRLAAKDPSPDPAPYTPVNVPKGSPPAGMPIARTTRVKRRP